MEASAWIFLDLSMALESSEETCPQGKSCGGSLQGLELSSLAPRYPQTSLALWE